MHLFSQLWSAVKLSFEGFNSIPTQHLPQVTHKKPKVLCKVGLKNVKIYLKNNKEIKRQVYSQRQWWVMKYKFIQDEYFSDLKNVSNKNVLYI